LTTDPNLGCGKPTREDVETRLATQPAPTGHYQLFLEALKKGVYSGVTGEIAKIAHEAGIRLERAIKMQAAQIALQISEQVSISSNSRKITIELEIPDFDVDGIVSETKHDLK